MSTLLKMDLWRVYYKRAKFVKGINKNQYALKSYGKRDKEHYGDYKQMIRKRIEGIQ